MLRKLVYFNTQLIDDIKRAVLSHKKRLWVFLLQIILVCMECVHNINTNSTLHFSSALRL